MISGLGVNGTRPLGALRSSRVHLEPLDVARPDSLFLKVLLMIFLGAIERPSTLNFCHNRTPKDPLLFEHGFGILRSSFLVQVVKKNGGTVLRANVGALAVGSSRVMELPEDR